MVPPVGAKISPHLVNAILAWHTLPNLENSLAVEALITANPWREALDQRLINSGLDCLGQDETPDQALSRLLMWEITIALDPAVSSDAAALVELGRAGKISDNFVDPPPEPS